MKNKLLIITFIFCLTNYSYAEQETISMNISSEVYKLSGGYFCKHESGYMGNFGIQQRNGTVRDPYTYNPKEPSREYIYFMYSSYPIPFHYFPIIEESDKEIFLLGTHAPFLSESKKDEPFSMVINKQNLSMKGTIINYKNEIKTFESQCSITRN